MCLERLLVTKNSYFEIPRSDLAALRLKSTMPIAVIKVAMPLIRSKIGVLD